jgi:hypothetical protein
MFTGEATFEHHVERSVDAAVHDPVVLSSIIQYCYPDSGEDIAYPSPRGWVACECPVVPKHPHVA